LCIWNKLVAGMGSFYRHQFEAVAIFKKGKASHVNYVQLGATGRFRATVWDYQGLAGFRKGRAEDLAAHPTVKPIALVADAIRDASNRNDIVLDPFAGSGTTILAAERTGRHARAIEIDAAYADVCIRRWQTMTGREAVLLGSRQTFAEIAEARKDNPAGSPMAAEETKPTVRARYRSGRVPSEV